MPNEAVFSTSQGHQLPQEELWTHQQPPPQKEVEVNDVLLTLARGLARGSYCGDIVQIVWARTHKINDAISDRCSSILTHRRPVALVFPLG